jgi:His/Glu/Gln/Arg/opine family amino acid ABC transporter permease subunit
VGPLGWVRANLFSSKINSLATLVMGALVVWFLWAFLSWSVSSAQWGVIYHNLRLVTSGLYDRQEIWRMELVAAILVLLSGLGLGIWGRLSRGVFFAVLAILFILVVVPVFAARVPEPTIYLLVEPQRPPSDFVFIGLKGQEVSFTFDPLTDAQDSEERLLGFVENQARTEWFTRAAEVRAGELDLGQHNLAVTLRLLDGQGRPLVAQAGSAAGIFAADPAGGTLSYVLPADGWHVLEVRRDDTANGSVSDNAGYAWIRVQGVETFASQEAAVQARLDQFGPPPTRERALFADENSYRFEGARSIAEFFSLQIAPLFDRIALPCFVGALLFFNGWTIGALGKREKLVRRAALGGWILSAPAILIILHGFEGSRTLPLVPTSVWGGLLLTILLTVVGIAASFPLGVALALGRRSELPAIKWTCTLIIEMVRGVPLITILFMAKQIVPFFWSALSGLDLTIRMMIGVTLFSAAYVAENVRGGLQIIPHGQIEAARALGLNPALTTTFIVLPQALRAVIPAIVGQFISLFKDTSLVAVVGLFELVGIVDRIVSGQAIYRPYQREAYIVIAIIYFVISYAMSDVSRRLEQSGAGSVRRL